MLHQCSRQSHCTHYKCNNYHRWRRKTLVMKQINTRVPIIPAITMALRPFKTGGAFGDRRGSLTIPETWIRRAGCLAKLIILIVSLEEHCALRINEWHRRLEIQSGFDTNLAGCLCKTNCTVNKLLGRVCSNRDISLTNQSALIPFRNYVKFYSRVEYGPVIVQVCSPYMIIQTLEYSELISGNGSRTLGDAVLIYHSELSME